jgi:geranylgeranyl transferase type-2 subunit alpha
MHGRRKAEYQAALLARSEAEKEAAKSKVLKYKQLAALALKQRREANEQNLTITTRKELEEELALSAQLLRVNPDVYTLWNHRKEAIAASQVVRHELEGAYAGEAGGAMENASPSTSFLKTELSMIVECIQKNPKSYGAWHHRRWLLEHAFPCTASSSSCSSSAATPPPQLALTLDKELALCAQFLDLDERNFHCWNYRRWVVSQHPGRSATDEFEFSTARIYKNFRSVREEGRKERKSDQYHYME